MNQQLEFDLNNKFEWTRTTDYLPNLPENKHLPSKPVTREFVDSLRILGLQEPIKVATLPDDTDFIVSGCRRIKAARELNWDYIDSEHAYMSLKEAIALRSALNNQRCDNAIADIEAVQYCLNLQPGATVKQIADFCQMTQGRVKMLLKMSQLPYLFLEGVKEGHISEETLRKLSTQPQEYISEAIKTYAKNLTEYVRRTAAGETPRKALFTNDDVVVLQQSRVADTVTQLRIPEFNFEPEDESPQQSYDAETVLVAPEEETVDGYAILYNDAEGNQTIHNYTTYPEDEAREIMRILGDSYSDLKDLHLVKLVRIQ